MYPFVYLDKGVHNRLRWIAASVVVLIDTMGLEMFYDVSEEIRQKSYGCRSQVFEIYE